MPYYYTKVYLVEKSMLNLAYKNFINYRKKLQFISIMSQIKVKNIIFISNMYNNFIKSSNMIKKSQKIVKLWTIRPLALYTNFKDKNQ